MASSIHLIHLRKGRTKLKILIALKQNINISYNVIHVSLNKILFYYKF